MEPKREVQRMKNLELKVEPKKRKRRKKENRNIKVPQEDFLFKNLGPIVKSHTFVIQKYIEQLLVVHNRKFDIRVWALVT